MSGDVLALVNDILQSIIVIFGASVVLYNLPYMRRDRVLRSFSLLLATVVLVFFTELLVSRTELPGTTDNWLRIKWLGIAFVPAAQFHLSDALLTTTGSVSWRRVVGTVVAYAASSLFYILVIFSDWITAGLVELPNAAFLSAGPLFGLFATFFWLTSVASIYNVWRAFRRSITSGTRGRMLRIMLAIMAAPLSVFPYLAWSSNRVERVPVWAWLLLITGNALVGFMFSQLTANIVYLGNVNSERVVRVKLLKFMARVPMTASIVLLVYVLTIRTSSFLGLDAPTAAGVTVVLSLMLVEWAIHAYKRPIERVLHFNNEPDVRRIQQLSERLITRQDMRQYLEGLLAAGCDALRSPAAFVAAVGTEGPQLVAFVGAPHRPTSPSVQTLNSLPAPERLREASDDLLVWQDYLIRPLYSRQGDVLVGILGVSNGGEALDLGSSEQQIVNRIALQAATALEDQLLQQSVFAAVEGLLPTITALQELRSAAEFGSARLLQPASDSAGNASGLINDPEFNTIVREALSHYWGGPKLTDSPLLDLQIVQHAADEHGGNPIKGLRTILQRAIERQRPAGERSLTRTEWLLYNILELKFVQGNKVKDVARRLAMSESDLYRKQRIAIENVARAIAEMEVGDSSTQQEGAPS